MIFLGLILGAIYSVVAFRNFRYGLFIFLAALPSYLVRFSIFGLPTTMLEILFWILFFVWLYKTITLRSMATNGLSRMRGAPMRAGFFTTLKMTTMGAVFLFFVASVIAIAVSPNHWQALGLWRAYFLEPILFFIILLSAVRDEESLDWIVWGLAVPAFYISFYAVAQRFLGLPITPPWQSEMRVTSLFDYPNAVGLFVAPILPLVLAQAIKYFKLGKSKIKLIEAAILLIILLLGAAAIIFAQSVGAVIGIVTGLGVFCIIYNRKARLAVLAVMAVALLAILLIPWLREVISQKLFLETWSGYVRKSMWAETWQMLKDNPLFGAGLGGYQTVFADYHFKQGIEIFLYPHTIIFNFWSELGILGLAGFGWMVVEFFRRAIKNICHPEFISGSEQKIPKPPQMRGEQVRDDTRTWAIAAAAAMIVILVHGLVDVPYFKNDLSILFWTIFAVPFLNLQFTGKKPNK